MRRANRMAYDGGFKMPERAYWIDLFTGKTWEEFLAQGGRVSGFRLTRGKTLQQVRVGDYLLCYLTGVSRFVGVLEVTSKPFQDSTPIWSDEVFPARVQVRTVVSLTPETGVPITTLKGVLSIFPEDKSDNYWTGFVRGSPSRWKTSDGEAVYRAVMEAQATPVEREVDPAKLARRPKALLSAKVGPVVVPPPELPTAELVSSKTPEASPEPNPHTEMQWLLAKLGSDMGLEVWIARNDKGRQYDGNRFADLPRLRSDLPLQFDAATNKTIELIDVLWLQKHSIVAAFEIESTTLVYSGLLRLSDLISMQPNLNIPLFIVAPDERREKVIAEVNRPTFSKLTPPMFQMCRLIAFSTLKSKLNQVGPYVRYLKPDFLDELAESCEVEEE